MLLRWVCLQQLYNQMPWNLSSSVQCCATCCPPACLLRLHSVACRWGKHPDGCQPYSGKPCAGSSPRTAHNSTWV